MGISNDEAAVEEKLSRVGPSRQAGGVGNPELLGGWDVED